MKYTKLGTSDLNVSRIVLGCMRIADKPLERTERLLEAAVEAGGNMFDHADIYGGGESERLFGLALKNTGIAREKIVVQSKCGIRKGMFDFSKQHILEAAEGSLKRLGTDRIDIYYQHRIDRKIPIEEVAGTMRELAGEGKIRRWGMSEPDAETIRRAHREFPVTAVENQYALTFRRHEEETFGVVEELGIGFVAYSPLDRGYLAGKMDGNTRFDPKTDMRAHFPRLSPEAMKKNRVFIDFLEEIGRKKRASCAQVALAWILAQKPWIVPIPETTRRAHLLENLRAPEISFSEGEMSEINARLSQMVPAGERYAPGSAAAKSVYDLI